MISFATWKRNVEAAEKIDAISELTDDRAIRALYAEMINLQIESRVLHERTRGLIWLAIVLCGALAWSLLRQHNG